MRIFWEKTEKLSQRWGFCPRTPVCLPRVVTPVYCYNFVNFISAAPNAVNILKKEHFLLFPIYCTYFSLQTP